MMPRNCLCGARAEVKMEQRSTKDGSIETVCWVECPVCGQLGPRVTGRADADPEALCAQAVEAWNEILRRARPSEDS